MAVATNGGDTPVELTKADFQSDQETRWLSTVLWEAVFRRS